MRRFLAAILLTLIAGHAAAQTGDEALAAEIEKLLTAVGGREAWREVKGFSMTEILHTDQSPVPVVRRYWVDFKQPRIKEVSIGTGLRQTRALNGDEGWTEAGGEVARWDAATVAGWRSFWPGIPTRIFHLLASDDPSLTASLRNGVIDFFIDGRRVVWIGTDANGTPVAYGRDDRHTETHFLGAMLPYGKTVLWSEATEPGGRWRVVMVDYELLNAAHTESFSAPRAR